MHHEVYRIAHQLSTEGKNPSVALIRSRLTFPVTLPVIVQALQQWKLNPDLGKSANQCEDSQLTEATLAANNQTISALEDRITTLEEQVAELSTLLKTPPSI